MAMRVRIVCPDHGVYDGEAAFVAIPSTDGQFGVMAHHASEICTIEDGYVRVADTDLNTIDHIFAVTEGYAQVADDDVIILVERAADLAQVDAEALQAEIAGFEDQLRNLSADDAYRAYLYNEIAWRKLQLAQ